MNLRWLAGLMVLVLAAFASWYLAESNRSDEITATEVPPVTRGYYLESARIFGTDTDGSLVYEILAEYAEQRPDQTVEFRDVQIRYAPGSDVPWRVDADTAIIDPDKPEIRLEGHVSAISTEGFSGVESEIRAPYLELDPERFIAETDARVQIRIGQRSLTATGMLASLQENRVDLRSNISGKFVP